MHVRKGSEVALYQKKPLVHLCHRQLPRISDSDLPRTEFGTFIPTQDEMNHFPEAESHIPIAQICNVAEPKWKWSVVSTPLRKTAQLPTVLVPYLQSSPPTISMSE